ncbi:MAG TPA: hypothetical protein VNJ51_06550 [Candidatus Dormibacteraeota bacterium]|nr:hypothetical protein [Candidatus Dormibacteraeota bacterium]
MTPLEAHEIDETVARWGGISEAQLLDELGAVGLFDGLPVVRPTTEALAAFLGAHGLDGSEVVEPIPPRDRAASVKALALCGVVAGCTPAHLPVLLACARALTDPALNTRGVLTTTGSAALAVIVGGPARERLGFSGGANCLGPGVRSNATVGRALSLMARFIGGALPGVTDMSTMGQPAKYTCCFAENEEESPWEPLHVERGLAPDDSAVTIAAIAGTMEVVNPYGQSARDYLHSLAETLAAPNALSPTDEVLIGGGQPLVLVSPEWARALAAEGFSKRAVKEEIFKRAACSLDRLSPSAREEVIRRRRSRLEVLRAPLRPARTADDILVIVAGGVGAKQTVMANWNGGSSAATQRI